MIGVAMYITIKSLEFCLILRGFTLLDNCFLQLQGKAWLCLDKPFLLSIIEKDADVAQLVEHELPKLGVTGSSPAIRSIFA